MSTIFTFSRQRAASDPKAIFDPSPAPIMLCHMQLSDSIPLSIARHTIQFIWQAALTTHNNNIIGLLGSRIKGEIDNATHTPLWQTLPASTNQDVMQRTQIASFSPSLKQLSQNWKNKNIFLSGIYQCARPSLQSMQVTEKLLSPYFEQHHDMPFIHLTISLNNKGVLESEAWIIENERALQIPMLLTEDGQTATKS